FATFEYNAAGQLSRITDVIQIASEFTYGASDFIDSLTTPYGTTRFERGEEGRNRWLEATDPLGGRGALEYLNRGGRGLGGVDPIGAPPGFTNQTLDYRNSFFWSKRAMALNPGDYTKAKTFHWLHSADLVSTAGVLESEKEPLESRVWYAYPGQIYNGQPD